MNPETWNNTADNVWAGEPPFGFRRGTSEERQRRVSL